MNNIIWKKYNFKTKLRVGDWVEIINRETEKAEQHQITNINPNNQGILECNDLIIDTNSVTRYGVVEPPDIAYVKAALQEILPIIKDKLSLETAYQLSTYGSKRITKPLVIEIKRALKAVGQGKAVNLLRKIEAYQKPNL